MLLNLSQKKPFLPKRKSCLPPLLVAFVEYFITVRRKVSGAGEEARSQGHVSPCEALVPFPARSRWLTSFVSLVPENLMLSSDLFWAPAVDAVPIHTFLQGIYVHE